MSVARITTTAAPAISYIWIGPPPKDTGGEPGHDIIGPMEMAACNISNPILFWCLLAQESTYKDKFKKYGNIQVCAVETYLNETLTDSALATASRYTTLIISEHLKVERNTVRDKVSVKNIFSLFLLLTKGGYVMDTNVMPASPGTALTLPSFERFFLPACRDFSKFYKAIDYWIMYSPKENKTNQMVFDLYLEKWKVAQEIYNTEKYSEKYFLAVGVIISKILTYDLSGHTGFWNYEYENRHKTSTLISTLGLRKYYYNTHNYENRSEQDRDALYTQKLLQVAGLLFQPKIARNISSYVPEQLEPTQKRGTEYTQIYFDILSNNTSGLQRQISEGADINQQMTNPHQDGESPLHLAIVSNKPACVKLLLLNKADPTLVVYYPGVKPADAFGLADLYSAHNDPEIQKLLIEHENSPFRLKTYYL